MVPKQVWNLAEQIPLDVKAPNLFWLDALFSRPKGAAGGSPALFALDRAACHSGTKKEMAPHKGMSPGAHGDSGSPANFWTTFWSLFLL